MELDVENPRRLQSTLYPKPRCSLRHFPFPSRREDPRNVKMGHIAQVGACRVRFRPWWWTTTKFLRCDTAQTVRSFFRDNVAGIGRPTRTAPSEAFAGFYHAAPGKHRTTPHTHANGKQLGECRGILRLPLDFFCKSRYIAI